MTLQPISWQWLLTAMAGVIVGVGLVGVCHGLLARLWHEMKRLGTPGPLSEEESRVVVGSCMFVGAAILAIGVLAILALWRVHRPATWLGVVVLAVCVGLDVWLWAKCRARMRESRRSGGYGPRGSD